MVLSILEWKNIQGIQKALDDLISNQYNSNSNKVFINKEVIYHSTNTTYYENNK